MTKLFTKHRQIVLLALAGLNPVFGLTEGLSAEALQAWMLDAGAPGMAAPIMVYALFLDQLITCGIV